MYCIDEARNLMEAEEHRTVATHIIIDVATYYKLYHIILFVLSTHTIQNSNIFFFIRSSWVCMSCACLLLFIGCFCSICTPAIALVIIESRVKSLWRAEQLSVVESCKTLITLRFTIRAIIMCACICVPMHTHIIVCQDTIWMECSYNENITISFFK